MADEVKADYEQLEQVANKFSNQSEEIQQMLQTVKNNMDKLEPDWIGRGSEAFFSEMQGEILPAVMQIATGSRRGQPGDQRSGPNHAGCRRRGQFAFSGLIPNK